MAKGQHLTHHQQGIVRRHYEHLETLTLQNLGEIVSDLFLADTPKKVETLWKRAEKALAKIAADDADARRALDTRDVGLLAALVSRIGAAPGKKEKPGRGAGEDRRP